VDFSHVQDSGAHTFSTRFGPEALRPLLEGTPLPASVHLRGTTVPAEPTGTGSARGDDPA
jgi:hypothetical protein